MTDTPATSPRWSQMSWNARRQAFSALARRHNELAEQVARLEGRKLELDVAIQRAEGQLARAMENIDLRHQSAWRRVIWANDDLWSEHERKAAHSAYARGDRSEWALVGERIYQRKRIRKVPCACGGQKSRGAKACDWCQRAAS